MLSVVHVKAMLVVSMTINRVAYVHDIAVWPQQIINMAMWVTAWRSTTTNTKAHIQGVGEAGMKKETKTNQHSVIHIT